MQQHKNEGAVSIGVIGAVEYDPRSDRCKGFITQVHKDIFSLKETLERVAGENMQGSRLTVRVLLGPGLDPGLASLVKVPWHSGAMLQLEACIPINHANLGSMLYFGANAKERNGSDAIAKAGWSHIRNFSDEPPRARPLECSDFTFERLVQPGERDICRMLEIYSKAFSSYVTDFSSDVVRTMAHNNIVIVARNRDGDICGTSQAELAPVEIDGCKWSIVELSDTAVHPDYKGRDLGRLCKVSVLKELEQFPNKVVYAEPRANHAAILKLNVHLGLQVGGYLPNHCVIDSPLADQPQESKYGDLFVFYPTLACGK